MIFDSMCSSLPRMRASTHVYIHFLIRGLDLGPGARQALRDTDAAFFWLQKWNPGAGSQTTRDLLQ